MLVSSGAKHSIYNAVQVLCDDGDEVIILRRTGHYPEMVNLAGGRPVILHAGIESGFKVTAEQRENRESSNPQDV